MKLPSGKKMFNEIKNFQPDFLVEKFSVKQSLSADFRTTPEAPVNENFLTGKLCEKTCILSSGKSYGPYLFVFFYLREYTDQM